LEERSGEAEKASRWGVEAEAYKSLERFGFQWLARQGRGALKQEWKKREELEPRDKCLKAGRNTPERKVSPSNRGGGA